MFATPAFAQAAAGAAAGGGLQDQLIQFVPLIGLVVLFYFLMIRPQQQRMKAHQAMLGGLKRGDAVVLSSGVHGKVVRVEDADVGVEIATGVTVKVRKGMIAQGIGRHSRTEIAELGIRSVDAMADYLGQKPYFMGSEPTGVDATIFAFAVASLCPVFDTPIRTASEKHDNLKRYVGRITSRYYPERTEMAGVKTAA